MKIYLFIILSILTGNLFAQSESSFRVMWYNVENLFDLTDNPLTSDNDFLPDGNRRWTARRYNQKLQQLAKVITAAGEWQAPAFIGLCEVENDSTLYALTHYTPLRQQDYRYCSGNSNDDRGIRVALLYQRDKFALLGRNSIPVIPQKQTDKTTRDILHVWGLLQNRDTLDVFLCHFPSRYGGEKESESARINAARILRELCDSVYRERETPQLLIMGDFNDTPENKSMTEVLKAFPLTTTKHQKEGNTPQQPHLINLFADPKRLAYPGSHKYQGEWLQLDHIIVNSELLSDSSSMRVEKDSPRLFTPSFLFTNDKTWHGLRPKRTYYGYKYEGGFSDHLPLLVDWRIIIKQ